jgi:transglutaminase-like putative cysteine protease
MLRLYACCLCVVLSASPAFAADPPADKPPVRNVDIQYTCEIAEVPEGTKTLDLWVPIVTGNDRQTVNFVNQAQHTEGRFTRDPKFGNKIYYRRYEAPFTLPIKLEFDYEIEVREATVPEAKQLVSTRQVDPGAAYAQYLSETKMIPIEGRVSQLAQEIKLPEGEPLRAGRAIYDHLIDTMVYNYLAKGAGSGDAVWACDSKTGDCTDFHSVFIGVCRWRGIPADHVFGMPIPPNKPGGDIKYCHCWARFWVADVGWIPIDASMADKSPGERDYYFGTLGSTWITLAHGRDVVLEPPQQGPPINMFDEPIAEADGQPLHVKWLGHYQEQPAKSR